MRSRLVALLGCGCLLAACAGVPAPLELPGEQEAEPGTLLVTSQYPRSGEITYRLDDLETTESGVQMRFTLHNGTSRHLSTTMLRVILRGKPGQVATARYPTGALRPGQSRGMTAVLERPGFGVRGAELEMIWRFE